MTHAQMHGARPGGQPGRQPGRQPGGHPERRRLPDRGDIVLGWLTRLVVVLGALGIVGFDVISVAATQFTVADTASSAAVAARDDWQAHHDVQSAYDKARATAAEDNAQNKVPAASFMVLPSGQVELQVDRDASTILFGHLPVLKDWVHRTATNTSPAPVG
ncbi:MAG: hypothetical protein ACTHMZ_04525 [Actinomycetes bacterium]